MGLNQKMVDLVPDGLVRAFASPYVAGYSLDEAIQTADRLHRERGIFSTLDLLGEELTSDEEVESVVARYLETLGPLADRPHASVSLKPTQMGIHRSYEYCRENIERVLRRSVETGTDVTIDMEDHTLTADTLRLYRELRDRFENVGTVLQSRLFRTDADIESLGNLRARVRICIGIYIEPPGIALTHKPEMKRKLIEQAGRLLDQGHTVEFATHDGRTVEEALNLVRLKGVPKDRYEFQFLMGVPVETLQRRLISEGIRVRLYVPFADKWKDATHYCKRRLANNPNMAFYVLGNLLKRAMGVR